MSLLSDVVKYSLGRPLRSKVAAPIIKSEYDMSAVLSRPCEAIVAAETLNDMSRGWDISDFNLSGARELRLLLLV